MHHHASRFSRIREGLCVREKVGQGVTQRSDPLPTLAACGRDRQHMKTQFAERGGELRLALLRFGSI